MAEQVASADSTADELIGDLRAVAQGIKQLGDENVRLRGENTALLREIGDARNERDDLADKVADWQELLLDFRSGVRDRQELIEGTVGR